MHEASAQARSADLGKDPKAPVGPVSDLRQSQQVALILRMAGDPPKVQLVLLVGSG